MSKELTEFESDAYKLFLYGLNSSSTKEKSVPRLEKFFNFIDLCRTMAEKCSIFARKSVVQPSWAVSSVMKYLEMNKDRNPERKW
jgi:hypothetical protein